MVQLVYSAGPVVRIALLIVLDHCSVYIGIRHADHGAGWSGWQKLGFRVFFVMESDKIKNHTYKDSFRAKLVNVNRQPRHTVSANMLFIIIIVNELVVSQHGV